MEVSSALRRRIGLIGCHQATCKICGLRERANQIVTPGEKNDSFWPMCFVSAVLLFRNG
jgi:hypothetical protein